MSENKHYYTDEKNARVGIAMWEGSNGSGCAQTGGDMV